jgi:pyridoxine 4-dehydrogenase
VNFRLMDPAAVPGKTFDAGLAELVKARDEGLIDGICGNSASNAQICGSTASTIDPFATRT